MTDTTRENCADILCIGTQKSSTSWLHHVLNAHPQTSAFPNMAPVTSTNKEAHFWDWNHKRGLDWYRELMTPSDPSLLSMDFTPEYSMLSDEKIAECKSVNPTAKLVYVLRDPLARAVSALRMHMLWRVRKSGETDVEIKFDDDLLALIQHARIIDMGSYVANYQRWARHYDNILVLNYEDIINDPESIVARLYAHVGLSIDTMDTDARAEFDQRMQKRVWASVPYPIHRETAYFLHGLLWPKRQAAESFFDFSFNEYRDVLAAAI